MTDSQLPTPMLGCFLRVFWALVGPGLIVIVSLFIAANRVPPGSPADVIFGGVVLATILARTFDSVTSEGPGKDQDDMGSIRRAPYIGITLVASGILLALAHFLGPRVF